VRTVDNLVVVARHDTFAGTGQGSNAAHGWERRQAVGCTHNSAHYPLGNFRIVGDYVGIQPGGAPKWAPLLAMFLVVGEPPWRGGSATI
jgi:hypothetical protein